MKQQTAFKLSKKDKNSTNFEMFNKDKLEVGFITFRKFEKTSAKKTYQMVFSDYCDYNTFLLSTNNGEFIYIETVYIYPEYRMQGYAHQIMDKFLNFIQKKLLTYSTIFLQAQPMEFNISLDTLKKFYATYGFSEFSSENIYDSDGEENNVQNLMFKII